MTTHHLALLPRVLAVCGLAFAASSQTPPSNGPAVGMPVAVNSRDGQGNPTALLRFKLPGLDRADPEQVTTELQGPGGLAVTPAALGWSSPRWQAAAPGAVGHQVGHVMQQHPSGAGVALLTASPPTAWTRSGGAWQAGGPWPARSATAATIEPSTGNLILFGGVNSSLLDDTWLWDGSNWLPVAGGVVGPTARRDHAIGTDPITGRVILFGGNDATGARGDTWEWDGAINLWLQLAPGPGPAARFGHRIAVDQARNRMVLFGGSDGTTTFDDTWEWNGVSWVQQAPLASPPPRQLHGMTYDPVRERVVMYGGTPAPDVSGLLTTYDDTWQYDGVSWCEIQRQPLMLGRAGHAMAFDDLTAECVVQGGAHPGTFPDDTWTLGQTDEPLPINDFSLGLDWIPADDNNPGVVDVPALSWIGMAFSVREGAVGQAGSRIGSEPSAGIGADLFAYVFDGSDPMCLPGHQVGDVTRAADAGEGMVAAGSGHDLNGLDVFLAAYHNGDNYTGNPLPPEPSIYFTVARDGIDRAPSSWWHGGNQSGATILVTDWDESAGRWSCPRVWIDHSEIRVPDPMAPTGFVALAADEEIDALAIGRNDGILDEPSYVVFSTNRSVPSGSGVTAAPDQLMISSPGNVDLPLIGLVLRVLVAGQQRPVSEEIGLDPADDVDACSTWDPCTLQASPVTPRDIFNRAFGIYTDPFAIPIPFGDGTVYRHNVGGTDTLTCVATRPGGVGGLLLFSPDINNPGVFVSFGLVPMAAEVAQTSLVLPPLLAGTGMFHWATFDGALTIERSSVLFEF